MWGLFSDIYSNDLNCICEMDEIIMSADDTFLVYVQENLRTLESHMNTRLTKVLDLCPFNNLSLNPTTSKFMLVTTKLVPTKSRLFLESDEIICKKLCELYWTKF